MNVYSQRRASGSLTPKTLLEPQVMSIDNGSLVGNGLFSFKATFISLMAKDIVVILDLARLSNLDGGGLAALLWCHRHAQERGGELKICGMNERVRQLLVAVRFHRIFDTFNTCNEALASIR